MIDIEKELRKSGIGPGWRPMVYTLLEVAQELDDTFKVKQIKEKFGSLRIYWDSDKNGINDPIGDLVYLIERVSGALCEKCGKNATTAPRDMGWLMTLCEEHHKEAQENPNFRKYE